MCHDIRYKDIRMPDQQGNLMCLSWERQESSSQGQHYRTPQWKAAEYLMCMVNTRRKGSPDDIRQHHTPQRRNQLKCRIHVTRLVFRLTHVVCTPPFTLQRRCFPLPHPLVFPRGLTLASRGHLLHSLLTL